MHLPQTTRNKCVSKRTLEADILRGLINRLLNLKEEIEVYRPLRNKRLKIETRQYNHHLKMYPCRSSLQKRGSIWLTTSSLIKSVLRSIKTSRKPFHHPKKKIESLSLLKLRKLKLKKRRGRNRLRLIQNVPYATTSWWSQLSFHANTDSASNACTRSSRGKATVHSADVR